MMPSVSPKLPIAEDQILRQVMAGEDSQWEFKQVEFAGNRPKGPSRQGLADEIAAFANADGGIILFGVTDCGEYQGLSRGQIMELDTSLVQICCDLIEPAVRIRTSHQFVASGHLVLVAAIPRGESLHSSPGGNYLRVGSSKRKMTNDESLRLAQRRGQSRIRSPDERTVPGTAFATLERSLWQPLLSAEAAMDPEPALRKMGLLARDECDALRATVAGLLLCTKTPERWVPGAGITATVYLGKDRSSGQEDATEITGPLHRQVRRAAQFVRTHMRVAAIKDPARIDVPEYSQTAVFEALVNAVAHRDYTIGESRIRISMFSDRLQINSPGSLPNSLTLENMGARQVTRNTVIASVLGRLPVGGILGSEHRVSFMERRGDGVPLIRRKTFELTGTEPAYRLIDDAELSLSLPRATLTPTRGVPIVSVRSEGKPLADASLLLLYPNNSWKRARTDEDGEAWVQLYSTHLPMTVFVAAHGYAARQIRAWVPNREPLSVELAPLTGGGSLILPRSGGSIPGLQGWLEPRRDHLGRMHLYGSRVTIDNGVPEPVPFLPGQSMRVTDDVGHERMIRVINVLGRSTLVEYHPLDRPSLARVHPVAAQSLP